jgi:hypothetical protein
MELSLSRWGPASPYTQERGYLSGAKTCFQIPGDKRRGEGDVQPPTSDLLTNCTGGAEGGQLEALKKY